jgi:hypothetical protein
MNPARLSALVIAAFCLMSNAATFYNVTKSGRRIQLDGFLMEWNRQEARPLNADSSIIGEIINTPEGLTGYFAIHQRDSCPSWNFQLYPDVAVSHRYFALSSDTSGGGNHPWYKVSAPDSSLRIVEWIVPWDTITTDSGGNYRAGLTGNDGCADTLKGVLITGSPSHKTAPPIITPRIKAQFLLILLLLTAYLLVRPKKPPKDIVRRPSAGGP